jgi:hypothetical protein
MLFLIPERGDHIFYLNENEILFHNQDWII